MKKHPNGVLVPSVGSEVAVIRESLLLTETDLIKSAPLIRAQKEFKGESFYLSKAYDWIIAEDSEGETCLIPTYKED